MSNQHEINAKQVLGYVDREVVPNVNKNGEIVKEFLKTLHNACKGQGSSQSLVSFDFMHFGSAYEGLAVNKNADFDIAVVLGYPFDYENITVQQDPSGYFTLRWKSHVRNKFFADCNDYIDSGRLRQSVFDSLMGRLQALEMPGPIVICTRKNACIQVDINYHHDKICVELVPQIVFRTWGHCPNLRPLGDLPSSLTSYVDNANKNKSPLLFFTVTVPHPERYSNPNQLYNVSFSLLVKEFLIKNPEIRDMVRLVKLVGNQRKWKSRFGFVPTFVKRVAVKYNSELKGKTVWRGYLDILKYLSHDLERGYVDGYFSKMPLLFQLDRGTALKFQEELKDAMKIDPREIYVL